MGRLWVYRNNRRQQGELISSGSWPAFFQELATDGAIEWGSTEWIRSSESRKIIREELEVGDLFLCWQTDDRAAIGIARLEELERGEWDVLYLEPVVEFPAPVPLRDLAEDDASLARVGFIAKRSQGTLARVTDREANVVLRACGVDPKTLDVVAIASEGRVGAGFGEASMNRQVELAGMKVVARELEGDEWVVEDRSKERGPGFDLRATRGGIVRHIEVKAVRGSDPAFILTEGELQAARRDRRWELALVTRAMTRPELTWYSRHEVLKELEIRPISHMVRDRRLDGGVG